MYKKCYTQKIKDNKYKVYLWDDIGYDEIVWYNASYIEDSEGTLNGINGEKLKKTVNWDRNTPNLHFHDMKPHQKYLVERYGTADEPSTSHRELFFDIECEIGGALTEEYIESAPMPITSIAWWDKQEDWWAILILDKKSELKHTKAKNKEIIPCKTEKELLAKFLEKFREIDPDILIGYNSDFFDIPYLYYRMCNVLGKEWANHLSPINKVNAKKNNEWFFKRNQFVDIIGVESLDYIRLHKKYSWKDEPSWKLLDEKLQYIALTKNLSHKGKHNYSEVYSNSITQDGAISAYLLSQGIIPPARHINPKAKKGYAGGYLFCPKAGLYKYMFDEDLTSLYPSIIMSLNIGRETFVGRIVDADDRNNRLGLNDLKKRDPNEELLIKNSKDNSTNVNVGRLINMIEQNNFSVSANGSIFSTEKESTLSTVLNKWFNERVVYKKAMKKAYEAKDKIAGEYNYLMQYTMKILLNSLYGATALPGFRYGLPESILSEAITLSGHRIIQESALCANKHMNKVIRNEIKLKI